VVKGNKCEEYQKQKMKTKEFNLSEKIIRANKGTYGDEVFPNGVIKPSDIKEFIKKIMEELHKIADNNSQHNIELGNVAFVLNKLAGDDLK